MSNCIDNNNSLPVSCQTEVKENFTDRKIGSQYLSRIYDFLGLHSRADRVGSCADTLIFKAYADGVARLHSVYFCKDRLCPMCNWRRSDKMFSQLSYVMNEVEKEGYRFLFLTLTLQNVPYIDLSSALDTLQSGFSKLLRKKEVSKICFGTFRCIEVTINREKKTMHPHIHSVLAVKDDYFKHGFIPQKKWAELWGQCIESDYIPVIWVKALKSGKFGLYDGVKELTHYLAKEQEYLTGKKLGVPTPEDIEKVNALYDGIFKRKLYNYTGIMKTVHQRLFPNDKKSDLLNSEEDKMRSDIAFVFVRYRWRVGLNEYQGENFTEYAFGKNNKKRRIFEND